MRSRRHLWAFTLLVLGFCSPAMAQSYGTARSVTYELEFLFTKPLGVRNHGMGWGGAADGTVAANLYYNPANLISHGGAEFSVDTQNWADEFDFLDAGAASRFRIGVGDTKDIHIAAGLWYAQQKGVLAVMSPQGGGGGTETTSWYLNLAVAIGLRTERFEIGVGGAVKPARIEFTYVDEEATTWAFDVGVKLAGLLADMNGHTLTGSAGASVLHMGDDATGQTALSELPTETRAGVTVDFRSRLIDTRAQSQIPAVALSLNAEVVDRSFQREIQTTTGSKNPPLGSSIGAELCLVNVFSLRMGWLDDGINAHVRSETYGGGVKLANEKFRFALDIAHLPEIYAEGPGVTSTGLSMTWFF